MHEMKTLYTEGVKWKYSDSLKITSRFIVTTCSLDSPARASVTCLTQFNGFYGCLYCYAKGQSLRPGKFVYPLNQFYKRQRTDTELRNDMAYAYDNNTERHGIKSISSLVTLPLFNIRNGVVVKAMHAVYLGVVRLHTRLFLTTTKAPYYAGSPESIKLIDKCLLAIKPPSCRSLGLGKFVTRMPTAEERDAIQRVGYNPTHIKCFKKMKLNGQNYMCEGTKNLKFCNSIIYDVNGTFGTITTMIKFQNNDETIGGMFIKCFNRVRQAFDCEHIHRAITSNKLIFVKESSLIRPPILMKTDKNLYLIKQTNCWESD
ncbi:hypothetical protein KQX54_014288 [Cotesia glomerata]|uniref:Uncharacterized protein n=1 Tax=Cotesia glomerata TaxID=32391 RepID=A0AAV7J6Z9_COTGL|nr:hypothetical protein KQX54_014288 [Cotesia glomerata]